MEEESDGRVARPAAEIPRGHHELVIVHPHDIPGRELPMRDLGEPFVDLAVGVPVARVKDRAPRHGVKQRPERPVGKAVIVASDVAAAQGHRLDPVGVRRIGDGLAASQFHARPSDPHAAPALHGRLQCGHQPAGGVHAFGSVLAPTERDRQTITHHDESSLGLRSLSTRSHGPP